MDTYYIYIYILISIYIYTRHQRYRDIPFITGLFLWLPTCELELSWRSARKKRYIHGWYILSHHCRTLLHTVDNALSWYAFLFHLKGCCRYHFLYRSTWKEQLYVGSIGLSIWNSITYSDPCVTHMNHDPRTLKDKIGLDQRVFLPNLTIWW